MIDIELLAERNARETARGTLRLDDIFARLATAERAAQDALAEVARLSKHNAELTEENARMREQLNRSSANSSQPPSKDPPSAAPSRSQKVSSGRRRGGQPGHRFHARPLADPARCRTQTDVFPTTCRLCDAALPATPEPEPHAHQVWELPRIEPTIDEYRLHRVRCGVCGTSTRARVPEGVPESGYGPAYTSAIGMLGAGYRLSVRMAERLSRELFHIPVASGTIVKLRRRASGAVAAAVEEAGEYVRDASVRCADETPFPVGNADGANPEQASGWLWVVATPLVIAYDVALSRGTDVAKRLLGETSSGVVVCDRMGSYLWVGWEQRQACWEHLDRDFKKLEEREEPLSRVLGAGLRQHTAALREAWAKYQAGEISRETFERTVGRLRRCVHEILASGAAWPAPKTDHSLRAETARFCRKVLGIEATLWTFTRSNGVPMGNNFAERSLRHAVVWRAVSHGSQSAEGARYAARMLTTVMSLRAQGRDIAEFLRKSCTAAASGRPGPSLLPAAPTVDARGP